MVELKIYSGWAHKKSENTLEKFSSQKKFLNFVNLKKKLQKILEKFLRS